MNKPFSNKIKVLSFVSAMLVVLIHGSAAETGGVSAWNACLHNFFTKQIAVVAVPFFFAVSGFWFARGYCAGEVGYGAFLKKKLRTLAVPYLCFSVIGLPFNLAYLVYWNYVHQAPLLDRTCLESGSLLLSLNRIFAVWGYDMPAADGPLWYVRALLIIFMCAPIWKFVYRSCHVLLAVGFVLIIAMAPSGMLPGITLQYGRASYFLLGMFLAHYEIEEWRIPALVEVALISLVVPFFAWHSYCIAQGSPFPAWLLRVKLLAIPVVLATFWFGYDFVVDGTLGNAELPNWLNTSFLIYCMHGPLEVYTVTLPRFLLGSNDYVVIFITLASAVVVTIACVRFSAFVRRANPALLSLLSGGRG